jgi:hypothetical protein
MRRDVHLEALRIAAKVALSIGLLDGCNAPRTREASATQPEPAPAPTTADTSEPATTPAPTPEHVEAQPVASDCRAVIAGAFPVASDYPGEKRDVSPGVQTCCALALVQEPQLEQHRWDCCANLADDVEQRVLIACSPWGPPVPPAMPQRTIARLA